MNIDVPLIPGVFPPGYCFEGWQKVYNDMFRLGIGQFPNNATVWNFGPTTPAADHRDRPWARTDPTTGAFDRVYVYTSGYWTSQHPIPPNSDIREMWVGPLTGVGGLDTYDGGNPGSGANTGPMWDVDIAFEGRVPIGVGVIPDDTTSLAVKDNYGKGTHTIVTTELPVNISLETTLAGFRANMETLAPIWIALTPSGSTTGATTPPNATVTQDFVNTGGGQNWKTSQPVRAVYFIKRTARVNYALPG